MTDYKRLQALIPEWEGWNHRWDSFGEAYEKAWLWWLAGALMQACRERGIEIWLKGRGSFIWVGGGEREPIRYQGDWPQAIIEGCAEALEND